MSPEQVSGRLDVDHRTDVYSLGLVLYEMLTLQRPIEAATREGVLRQVMTKSRPPVSWKNPAVSRNFERVVHKAIAHDPDERYQSASALGADLQNVVDRKPVAAPPYRYKADLREIAAQRPRAVTMLSIMMMSVSLFWFNNSAMSIFLLFRTTTGRATGIRLLGEEVMEFAVWTAVALVVLAPSVILYLGYSWARWAVSASVVLPLVWYFWGRSSGLGWLDDIIPTAMLIFLVGVILLVSNWRDTRDWLAFAGRLRAEQRHWRSASRE
jgi:hypothetical protein